MYIMIELTEILEILKLLAMAALGTLGFSIIFYIHPRRLALATLGGLIAGGIYIITVRITDSEFISTTLASFAATAFSEIAARKTMAPAVVYLVPGIITLVPGNALYYTMNSIVSENYTAAMQYGKTTIEVALGISGGLISASIIWALIQKKQLHRKMKTKN